MRSSSNIDQVSLPLAELKDAVLLSPNSRLQSRGTTAELAEEKLKSLENPQFPIRRSISTVPALSSV